MDLSVTPGSVISSIPLQALRGISAVNILGGQNLYKLANGTLGLADSNGVSPANSFAGVALHSSRAGHPVRYIKIDPDFVPGFTAVAGDPIYLSDTPGGSTKTYADVASGSTVILLGVMTTTTHMNLNPIVGGVK